MMKHVGVAMVFVLQVASVVAAPPSESSYRPMAVGAAVPSLDTATLDRVIGTKGAWNAKEGVYKISYPRTDVAVTVDGNRIPPFMGLTSWTAFQEGMDHKAMVMGDLVLFEDEVNPVMSAALESGLEVTALHNHFFHADPPVYFMHIGGEGTPAALAKSVRQTLDAARQVRSKSAQPARRFGPEPVPTPSAVSPEPLEAILGVKAAAAQNGMVKFVVGRRATMPGPCTVGTDMGVNTWAAFMGSETNAVVDGDFVCTVAELQGVLKALRGGGIQIVAIHNHMTTEEPRLIFLHYWGQGSATTLAGTLKKAMAQTESPPRQ